MHDIKFIRDNTDAFVAGLDRRGGGDGGALANQLLKLDEEMTRYWDAPVNTPALRWGT